MCEAYEVNRALARIDREKDNYRKSTLCINCHYNNHHKYQIMDGYIIASICESCGEWLDPSEYRSTIYEMGCEVWQTSDSNFDMKEEKMATNEERRK